MEQDKLFSKETLLQVPACILLNFILAQVAGYFPLPLFLDSVGTILAGALGGALPGITVGFFSNAFNAIGDPITLYYGILNMGFGLLAAVFAKHGLYRRFGTALLTAIPYFLIGGALGSLLTWMLSGLNIGTGISSPFALSLLEKFHFSRFFAQFAADVLIDFMDKIAVVTIVFVTIRLLPDRFLLRFPLGFVHVKQTSDPHHAETETN